MSFPISEEHITRISKEEYKHPDVEEKLYADVSTLSTTLAKVQEETIPAGYEGIIISVAVSADETAILYVERDGKQYYENGLNCAGLSHVPQAAGTAGLVGVGPEVPLLIHLKEKAKWALGFKAASGTPKVNWRIRVRHFKKGA